MALGNGFDSSSTFTFSAKLNKSGVFCEYSDFLLRQKGMRKGSQETFRDDKDLLKASFGSFEIESRLQNVLRQTRTKRFIIGLGWSCEIERYLLQLGASRKWQSGAFLHHWGYGLIWCHWLSHRFVRWIGSRNPPTAASKWCRCSRYWRWRCLQVTIRETGLDIATDRRFNFLHFDGILFVRTEAAGQFERWGSSYLLRRFNDFLLGGRDVDCSSVEFVCRLVDDRRRRHFWRVRIADVHQSWFPSFESLRIGSRAARKTIKVSAIMNAGLQPNSVRTNSISAFSVLVPPLPSHGESTALPFEFWRNAPGCSSHKWSLDHLPPSHIQFHTFRKVCAVLFADFSLPERMEWAQECCCFDCQSVYELSLTDEMIEVELWCRRLHSWGFFSSWKSTIDGMKHSKRFFSVNFGCLNYRACAKRTISSGFSSNQEKRL